MDLTAIILTLVWIGIGLIVAGIVFAAIGFFIEGPRVVTTQDGGFVRLLIELARKCFKIMADPNETRARKLQAFGMILIIFGLLFLVASLFPLLIQVFANGGDGNGSPTPTPTS